MKYYSVCIAVKSVAVSTEFYTKVLGQKVVMDFGINVSFEGGLSIQEDFSRIIGVEKDSIMKQSHNFELYFEEEDFDGFLARLETVEGIRYLHKLKEQEWGQRLTHFYDPDGHLIEVGESMEQVIIRFLREGMTVEEVSKRSMYPLPFIQQIKETL